MSRDPYIIGTIPPGDITPRVAMRCGWCREWKTKDDFVLHVVGAPTSHGICATCAAKHFPESHPHDSETNAARTGETNPGTGLTDGGDGPLPAA